MNISHLGGKLSLSVEGVQVSDHDVSRLLELHALGRLVNRVQGLLLHGGVKGHSSLAAVGKPAALCRRRRLAVQLPVTRRLERQAKKLFCKRCKERPLVSRTAESLSLERFGAELFSAGPNEAQPISAL